MNADATAGVVNGNGSLINLSLRVFFADTANYNPQIDVTNITFEGLNGDIRNKCITAEGTEGDIAYQTCVQSVRGVIIGSQFTFEGPDSKIVSGGTIDVKFNVAFDVDTKLEVMDITGALVDLPLDTNLKAGTYQANIPTDKLSNGQYFLRITAGPFSETINVMLQK